MPGTTTPALRATSPRRGILQPAARVLSVIAGLTRNLTRRHCEEHMVRRGNPEILLI